MLILTGITVIAAAYLLGSLPFSIWTGKYFFGKDVREHGSGNAGATNTWRVFGWKAGLAVMVLDCGKGFGAVFLPYLFSFPDAGPESFLWLRIVCGMSVAVGHIFPVFAGFRGGKAVATMLGATLGLMPLAAAGSLGIFVITLMLSGYVSAGSILAAAAFPFLVMAVNSPAGFPLILFSGLAGAVILLTHLKNLGRLVRREEKKVILFRKKS